MPSDQTFIPQLAYSSAHALHHRRADCSIVDSKEACLVAMEHSAYVDSILTQLLRRATILHAVSNDARVAAPSSQLVDRLPFRASIVQ